METHHARMSQSAYGKARDLSRQRVNQLVKDGRVPLDDDGLVIVDQADLNLATMLDQRKANRARQIAKSQTATPDEGTLLDEAGDRDQVPAESQKPADKAKAATVGATDYWEQKARREKIEADRAALSLRKTMGELVDADEVARSRFATAQKVANALLQIPSTIAPVVAPGDPLRAELLMTEEIKKVINELAGDLDQPAAGDDAQREEARAA